MRRTLPIADVQDATSDRKQGERMSISDLKNSPMRGTYVSPYRKYQIDNAKEKNLDLWSA